MHTSCTTHAHGMHASVRESGFVNARRDSLALDGRTGHSPAARFRASPIRARQSGPWRLNRSTVSGSSRSVTACLGSALGGRPRLRRMLSARSGKTSENGLPGRAPRRWLRSRRDPPRSGAGSRLLPHRLSAGVSASLACLSFRLAGRIDTIETASPPRRHEDHHDDPPGEDAIARNGRDGRQRSSLARRTRGRAPQSPARGRQRSCGASVRPRECAFISVHEKWLTGNAARVGHLASEDLAQRLMFSSSA